MIRKWWNTLWSRKTPFRLGVALIVGGIGGVIFWGGFNTFMEYTNTMEFCISCHEMRDNVYAEYTQTVHYKNASGVRAICSDCHVPKPWTAKLIRKIQASNELFHKVIGTIDTKEKFQEHRLEMAERVWATMKANDSRECRNCHSFETMDFHKQKETAAKQMQEAMKNGDTCIDCHKGIAHHKPDMAKRAREEAAAFMARTEDLTGDHVWAKRTTGLVAEPADDASKLATVLVGVGMTRLESSGDYVKVRVEGWQAGQVVRGQYAGFGLRALNLSISASALDQVKKGETRFYEDGNQDWVQTSLDGWVKAADLTSDDQMLWSIADRTFSSQCGACHSPPDPASRDALAWQTDVDTYAPRTSLTGEEKRFVLRYLQVHGAGSKEAMAIN
ncbi:trimethylamine-N-oxide reductase cytochrome c-type subunit TorC [Rhodobium orientis]|uniref:Cytochrome c-type protein n=1 Tax=Rhodobium orientis TaxID=34017 RepID=A0A327JTA4_9HYPH|nr:NapC/NirT family cytochrome c [Rhodobium orientis]MBB4302937.1 trimethylamine-N-oxide reductase cytochrome c-type subunit TorC [Rhodobium orientis]MBK5949498.1 hypothetical protein [Rhodobium orientis]RAI29291.1 hypothetical protein CH339_03115 [Rhodobium orientis]